MRHLPVNPNPAPDAIDEIQIASPCAVPWDSMRGDQRVRFCGQCRQNVYNIAELSRPQSRRLIEAREQQICVRILRRDDGTVVTADCWTRLRAARRKGWLTFAALLLVIGWGQLWAVRFGWLSLKQLGRPRCATGAAVASEAIKHRPEEPSTEPSIGEPPAAFKPLAGHLMGAPPPVGHRLPKMGKRLVADSDTKR